MQEDPGLRQNVSWHHPIANDQVEVRLGSRVGRPSCSPVCWAWDRKERSRRGLMDLESFGIHYRLLPWGGPWFGHEGDDDVSKLPAGRAVHHDEPSRAQNTPVALKPPS